MGQAAELALEVLPDDDDAAAGVEDLLSELPDEELDEEPDEESEEPEESDEDVLPDAEAFFPGLLLDDEPRLSLR